MGIAGRNAARQVLQRPRDMSDRSIAAAFQAAAAADAVSCRARAALSQVDSFIPWAGYSTVDVFTTVEQEYFAIRNTMHAL